MIPYLLDYGVGVGGCEQKFGCKSVYGNWDGFNVLCLMQWEVGVRLG